MRLRRHNISPSTYYLSNIRPIFATSYNTLVCTLLPTYPGKLTLITSLLRPTSCKRNFPLAPVSLKPPFIKYLVRSKLGNAAAIWDSNQVTLAANVESLQTRGARFMLANYHRTASVSPMKANLSLPLL